ncbi:hypothetical protein BU16DRAFT_525952 [Lophium mytilinum]|uniref:Uncharacterized protein n=1 Tax=Lophium mytilinum TaxID=390894 RepID=A0A6A6QYH0_9PEZI|nr:hypothetical protein BU16DRAFT_525952 [Lophium mytilinum]
MARYYYLGEKCRRLAAEAAQLISDELETKAKKQKKDQKRRRELDERCRRLAEDAARYVADEREIREKKAKNDEKKRRDTAMQKARKARKALRRAGPTFGASTSTSGASYPPPAGATSTDTLRAGSLSGTSSRSSSTVAAAIAFGSKPQPTRTSPSTTAPSGAAFTNKPPHTPAVARPSEEEQWRQMEELSKIPLPDDDDPFFDD